MMSFCMFESSVPGSGAVNNIEWMKGLGFHGKSSEKYFYTHMSMTAFPLSQCGRKNGIQGTWNRSRRFKTNDQKPKKGCLAGQRFLAWTLGAPNWYLPLSIQNTCPTAISYPNTGPVAFADGEIEVQQLKSTHLRSQSPEFISHFLLNFTNRWLGNFLRKNKTNQRSFWTESSNDLLFPKKSMCCFFFFNEF